MKNIDWGWQGKARKLRMRGEYLWEHMPIPADVVFHVPNETGGIEEIPAHKWMLGIGSQVFYAMFYGPNAPKTEGITTVSIPNCTADVFKMVLKFLYSDRMPSYRTSLEHWMDVLICADQYGIVELTNQCRKRLCDALLTGGKNGVPLVPDAAMVHMLARAEETGDLDIIQATKQAIVREGKRFLDFPRRLKSFEFLCAFVKLNEVQSEAKDEIRIYQAVRTWAQGQQADHEKEGSPQRTLRDIMGPIFEAIRFPLMSSAEIAEGPVKDGMFTISELSALYQQQFSTDAAKPRIFVDSLRAVKDPFRAGQLKLYVSRLDGSGVRLRSVVIVIQPFIEGVSATVDKFLRLCAENYQFDVQCDGWSLVNFCSTTDRFPDSSLSAELRKKLVELAIPDAEKKVYIEDSAGTVSLRWRSSSAINERGYFTLCLSLGKCLRMNQPTSAHDGIVFGRIVGNMHEQIKLLRCVNNSLFAHLVVNLKTSVAVP